MLGEGLVARVVAEDEGVEDLVLGVLEFCRGGGTVLSWPISSSMALVAATVEELLVAASTMKRPG